MSHNEREALFSSTKGFSLQDLSEPPTELADDEVLIRPKMVGICGSDLIALRMFEGENLRIGHEWVGEVIAAGAKSNFSVGDRVSSPAVLGCGTCEFCQKGENNLCTPSPTLGSQELGMLRTWVVLKSFQLSLIPQGCDDESAALLEVAGVADEAFRLLDSLEGKKEKLLIVGAGPVGTFCALLAKERGLDYQLLEVEEKRVQKAQSMELNVLPLGQALIDPRQAGLYDAIIDCSGDNNNRPGFWKYFHYFAAIGVREIVVGKYKTDPVIRSNIFAKKQAQFFWMRGMSSSHLEESIKNWCHKIDNYKKYFVDEIFSLDQVQDAFDFAKGRKETLKVMIKID